MARTAFISYNVLILEIASLIWILEILLLTTPFMWDLLLMLLLLLDTELPFLFWCLPGRADEDRVYVLNLKRFEKRGKMLRERGGDAFFVLSVFERNVCLRGTEQFFYHKGLSCKIVVIVMTMKGETSDFVLTIHCAAVSSRHTHVATFQCVNESVCEMYHFALVVWRESTARSFDRVEITFLVCWFLVSWFSDTISWWRMGEDLNVREKLSSSR